MTNIIILFSIVAIIAMIVNVASNIYGVTNYNYNNSSEEKRKLLGDYKKPYCILGLIGIVIGIITVFTLMLSIKI